MMCSAELKSLILLITFLSLLFSTACGETELSIATEHECGYTRLLKAGRVPAQQTAKIVNDFNVSHPSLSFVSSDGYKPIRIGIFTLDLEDPSRYCTAVGQAYEDHSGSIIICEENDILTNEKRKILLKKLLPKAINLHMERLRVKPVEGKIVVPTFGTFNTCSTFRVPDEHRSTGVSGYDFLLYVSAAPTRNNLVAWATSCATNTVGRPIVGASNISPSYLSDSDSSARIIAHEMGHALGFNLFSFMYSKMVSNISNAGGAPWSMELTSPNVRATGASLFEYYNIPGVSLEDEGGAGTMFHHWERRTLKNELMTGIVSTTMYYTAFTLSAFEDLGYYQVDYSKAEVMPWGHLAGETFINGKCLVDGLSQFPDMFCDSSTPELRCTEDRLGMGVCEMKNYTTKLPAYNQYFSDPFLGGSNSLMNYCPIINVNTSLFCASSNASLLPGSIVSSSSRCLRSSTTEGVQVKNGQMIHALCADIKCSDKTTGTYQVKFASSSSWVNCPAESEIELSKYSTAFSSGVVKCPSYLEVCSYPTTPLPTSVTVQSANARGLILEHGWWKWTLTITIGILVLIL